MHERVADAENQVEHAVTEYRIDIQHVPGDKRNIISGSLLPGCSYHLFVEIEPANAMAFPCKGYRIVACPACNIEDTAFPLKVLRQESGRRRIFEEDDVIDTAQIIIKNRMLLGIVCRLFNPFPSSMRTSPKSSVTLHPREASAQSP